MIEQNPDTEDLQEATTRLMAGGSTSPPETVDASQDTASPTIPPGTLVIHTYRIERLLGSGGMGEVFLARHVQLGTSHAIKVIRPTLFSDHRVLDLFQREAAVLRGIRHDAIVSYDGFFRDETGRNYLVMEYVDGPSLSDYLGKEALSLEKVFSLRDRLAGGLAAAHRKGAVHRDIAPDNVILPEGEIEQAKLIDFGLAKLTDPDQRTIVGSAFAGKFRYASPEQMGLYDGAVDARSDIYSLGLLLAFAATGQPLDMGSSFYEVLHARKSVPDLQAIPATLRDQLGAMLQPDPACRPQDIAELLRRWPTPGSEDLPFDRQPKSGANPRSESTASGSAKPKVRRWLWLAVATTALAIALAVGYRMICPSNWLFCPRTTDIVHEENLKPQLPIDQLAKQPWFKTAPYFDDWLARGQTDKAFALLETMVRRGRDLPPDETFSLAQNLLSHGRLSDAFALFKVLAAGGDARSMVAVAKMYDPLLWSTAVSPFSRPNARQAEMWYRRALKHGSQEARERLDSLRDGNTDRAGGDEDVR